MPNSAQDYLLSTTNSSDKTASKTVCSVVLYVRGSATNYETREAHDERHTENHGISDREILTQLAPYDGNDGIADSGDGRFLGIHHPN